MDSQWEYQSEEGWYLEAKLISAKSFYFLKLETFHHAVSLQPGV